MTWPLKTKFYLEKDGEKCYWVVDDSGRIEDRVISKDTPLGKCLLEAKPGRFSFRQPNGLNVEYDLLRIEVQNSSLTPSGKGITVFLHPEIRRKSLQERILSRGIQFLVHFTPVSNLHSIMRNGLLSRMDLNQRRIPFGYSDEGRRDCLLDFISTSVSFPNYKMFYAKRSKAEEKRWAVVKVGKEVLWELGCLFFTGNAASSVSMAIPAAHLCSIDAFDRMFYEKESRSLIPESFTTDPQAEVMVYRAIPSRYIKGIALESKDDMKLIKDANDLSNIEIDRTLFSPRMDYDQAPKLL